MEVRNFDPGMTDADGPIPQGCVLMANLIMCCGKETEFRGSIIIVRRVQASIIIVRHVCILTGGFKAVMLIRHG